MAKEPAGPSRPFPITLAIWEALPRDDRLGWASLRQGMLNVILAEGCGYCCGGTSPRDGGQRIECPMLEKLLPKEQERVARACAIPAMYADVWQMRRQVSTAEVVAARPDVPWAEWSTAAERQREFTRRAAGEYREGWQSLHGWGFDREAAEALIQRLPTSAWTLAPEGRHHRWLELGYYVRSPFRGVTLAQVDQLARARMREGKETFPQAAAAILTLRRAEVLALLGMQALAGEGGGEDG